jgi:hypothetical protein
MVARRTTLLTSKQQQFVEAYVSGKSASDAYRLAYDALNMSSTSINKEASRLIAKQQIRALIEELQEESRVATKQALIASKQEVLMRLTRYMRTAEPGDSTRLRAAELMGKQSVELRMTSDITVLAVGEWEPIARGTSYANEGIPWWVWFIGIAVALYFFAG